MSFYLVFQMCLLGLWGGEVEEIGNILGRIFLTNVLIFADKSGAYHSTPKFSYPQVDSASWCWPRQDVSMSIGIGETYVLCAVLID